MNKEDTPVQQKPQRQESRRKEMQPPQRKEKRKQTSTAVHKIFTVVGAVLCVVLGFVLICNITILIKTVANPDTPPSVLGVTPMVVQSGSMSGTAEDHIEVGDLIFVTKTDAEKLEVGDIIAYMEGGVVITHRIVAIETDENGGLQFTTKGDANNAEDQDPVAEDQLVGIYIGRIPGLGDFALFLQKPVGMLLCVGLPLAALLVWDLIRRRRYDAREKKRTEEMEAELSRLRALSGNDSGEDQTE